MFMFHPQNTVAWRVTEELNFPSLTECQYFYYENENTLVNGLRNHMVGAFGPINGGRYTLMELGCVAHNGESPVVTQRTPLSTTNVLEEFIVDKIDV